MVDNLNEWEMVMKYSPETWNEDLNFPGQESLNTIEIFSSLVQLNQTWSDIMLAHKVIDSGLPNRWGCRIPMHSNWRLEKFSELLGTDYDNLEIIEWLRYGTMQDGTLHQHGIIIWELICSQLTWMNILKKK